MKLLELYECGCYQDGTCALSEKEADCIYYKQCTTGGKAPKLVKDEDEEYITDNI
jgi:hypothetical protein